MIVQFTRQFPPYNASERAEFEESAANAFINAGVAQAVVAAADVVKEAVAEDAAEAPEAEAPAVEATPKGKAKK